MLVSGAADELLCKQRGVWTGGPDKMLWRGEPNELLCELMSSCVNRGTRRDVMWTGAPNEMLCERGHNKMYEQRHWTSCCVNRSTQWVVSTGAPNELLCEQEHPTSWCVKYLFNFNVLHQTHLWKLLRFSAITKHFYFTNLTVFHLNICAKLNIFHIRP